MKENNTMGERIKEQRKKMGMTQEELAEVLYMKKVTISAYENDRIDIKSSVVIELARLLECGVGYLMEGAKDGIEGEIEELVRLFRGIESAAVRKVAVEQVNILISIK